MMLLRPARGRLSPFVSLLWASAGAPPPVTGAARERVLPTGATHVVIRLGKAPLRLFACATDAEGHTIGSSVIGGVRDTAYVKEAAGAQPTVGAMLRPGAVELVSNTPAGALAGRHTALEDLWRGADLSELRERLESAHANSDRLAIFEAFLSSRLPDLRGIDPLIAHALGQLDRGIAIGELVAESGFSHRHLVRTFADATGLSPKRYQLLKRFNRTIEHLHAVPDAALADVAMHSGYADQAHMNRDFQAFAGLTPAQYRRIAPAAARHVPIRT